VIGPNFGRFQATQRRHDGAWMNISCKSSSEAVQSCRVRVVSWSALRLDLKRAQERAMSMTEVFRSGAIVMMGLTVIAAGVF
jgi:hypothetical protein